MKIKRNIAYLLGTFMAILAINIYGNCETSASYNFEIQNDTPDKILSVSIYAHSPKRFSNVRSSVRSNIRPAASSAKTPTKTITLNPGEYYLEDDVSIDLPAYYQIYVWDQQRQNVWYVGEGSLEKESSITVLASKEETSEQFKNDSVTQDIEYDSFDNQGTFELTLESIN